jgi:hypothetical protein
VRVASSGDVTVIGPAQNCVGLSNITFKQGL